MSKTAKPRLHLVKSGLDAGLYCQDLDWYFNAYDSECGLKSIGVANVLDAAVALSGSKDIEAIPVKVSPQRNLQRWFEGGPWDDHHAQFKGRGSFCVFTKGRRVWSRLHALTWTTQDGLRQYYEARQLWTRDEDYWHDALVSERFETNARELRDAHKRRPSTFKTGRIELSPADEALVRAWHQQYYLKQEAA